MVTGVTIKVGQKRLYFRCKQAEPMVLVWVTSPILFCTLKMHGAVVAIVDNLKDCPNAGYDPNLYSTSYLVEPQSSIYAMTGEEECAVVLKLPEGSYTALVGSNGETSGKAVVAAFDFE